MTTENRIIKESRALLKKIGASSMTMDMVAHSCGISKRTLYEVYENKECLLLECLKKYKHLHEKGVEEMLRTKPNVMEYILASYRDKLNDFRHTNPTFYSDMVKYPKVVEVLQQDQDVSRQRFLEFMERGISEGYFRADVNFDLVARIYEVILRFIMDEEVYRTYDIEEIFRSVIFVSLRGYCTKKGVDVLDSFLNESNTR
jgi:AcrR family transcriptional regulator